MSRLFTPLRLRGTTFANRVWVSPMCEYSAVDGVPQDWHLVHLGSLARGGAGLVFTEATAVLPEGRISPVDTGIWNDAQLDAWRRIADFVRSQETVPGIQLAHAGRKASTQPPWIGRAYVPPEQGGWTNVVAPSAVPFGALPAPRAMTVEQIRDVVAAFGAAARRAVAAGFEAIEIHAAHGYLLHEFLSPLTNHRTDGYGGDRAGRMRLALEVARAVRAAVGEAVPVLTRISATDWVDGGWTVEDSVVLAGELAAAGVDLVDASSGGAAARASIPVGPGYQVPLAARIRRDAGVLTGAVGLIVEPEQAEQIVATGEADLVLLGRELLRDPYWPHRAAAKLTQPPTWPHQYTRAF
jgi:2,4-dienoyl-CoA reductase-like NADH-dependent reductase (Old Yellow Enzyme family)